MNDEAPKSVSASAIMGRWWMNIENRVKPIRWKMGVGGLSQIEMGPQLLAAMVAPPGTGKTALIMQLVVDGLLFNPELRATVCNVEMQPDVLMDRQLSRLSGVACTPIHKRTFQASELEKLRRAKDVLSGIADRLTFVEPPYTFERSIESAIESGSDLIVMDYLQAMVQTPEGSDKRQSIEAAMQCLRQFARKYGKGIIVVSSCNRASYKVSSLGSAAESSAIEFGVDELYGLQREKDANGKDTNVLLLKHHKARYGDTQDIRTIFNRAVMRIEVEGAACLI